jgi:hypothetical protein
MILTSGPEGNTMLKTLYEFEKENKNIYDDVREYCIAERVNEEYFRASMVQKGLQKGLKHKLVIIY